VWDWCAVGGVVCLGLGGLGWGASGRNLDLTRIQRTRTSSGSDCRGRHLHGRSVRLVLLGILIWRTGLRTAAEEQEE